MKNVLVIISLLIMIGCKNTPEPEKVNKDDVEDFMENVFGEKSGEPFDCDALISNIDFSKLCIGREDDFKVRKDIENPLICIHVLKSKNSTVDIAINRSPMSLITTQVFRAAKSDAEKKGKVNKIKKLGDDAFFSEYDFSSGSFGTKTRDLVFYQEKAIYTLHSVSGSKKKKNCMSNESQLKKLAHSILNSANN